MAVTILTLMATLMLAVPHAPAREATPNAPAPVDVFVAGEGGHATYRIPSIIRLVDGALLVFAEGRDSASDNGANDIVLRRSEDGGAT